MKTKLLFLGVMTIAIGSGSNAQTTTAQKPVGEQLANEIRAEALRKNNDPAGHALPLLASWNTGTYLYAYPYHKTRGMDPAYQMDLLRDGHHLFPTFAFPSMDATADKWKEYYQAPLQRAAKLNLPITLLGTQWEQQLTLDEKYFSLPAEENPNVVTPDGKIEKKLSPFGPVKWWREIGAKWASSAMIQQIQQWYPQPPLVEFLSNNEAPKLRWMDVEQDARYLQKYGKGRSDAFKKQIVAEGWMERYQALQQGMRGALNQSWQSKVLFAGYGAFGLSAFGRWNGWPHYALNTPDYFDPDPLMWDGGTPSYYCANYNNITDFKVMSPQIESMNWIFMQRQARQLNPDFRFGFSIWDGHTNKPDTDWRAHYESMGQQYTPSRYAGYAQFGLWLLRPRVLREYRNWTDSLTDMKPWFLALAGDVDRVYSNDTLKYFWRKGELVPNRAQQHPYQVNIPDAYKNVDRWFLLDTNLDPPRPWKLTTEIPVFSLALVTGEKGNRRWLVYAHSPVQDRKNVGITIPAYGKITVDVPAAGVFYVVEEKSKRVKSLNEVTELLIPTK